MTKVWSFDLPLFFDGAILDVETNRDGEVTCLGVCTRGKVNIYGREKSDTYSSFMDEVRLILSVLKRPFYAFNKSFEEGKLGILVDEEISLFNRRSKFGIEKKKFAIKVDKLYDPFFGEGIRCLKAWSDYVESGHNSLLYHIMRHNLCCVLQELCLVVLNVARR